MRSPALAEVPDSVTQTRWQQASRRIDDMVASGSTRRHAVPGPDRLAERFTRAATSIPPRAGLRCPREPVASEAIAGAAPDMRPELRLPKPMPLWTPHRMCLRRPRPCLHFIAKAASRQEAGPGAAMMTYVDAALAPATKNDRSKMLQDRQPRRHAQPAASPAEGLRYDGREVKTASIEKIDNSVLECCTCPTTRTPATLMYRGFARRNCHLHSKTGVTRPLQ